MPGVAGSMEDKWRTAWSLFDEDLETPIEYQCHAQCWLTYRAIDGHVSREEYEHRIWQKHQITLRHPDGPRWITSQAASDFYLWTLWDRPERAERAAETLMEHWRKYPPAVLSMLRVMTTLAYKAHLDDNSSVAKAMIQEAIGCWQQVMGQIDWMKYPLRFLDGKGDMMALHALSCLAGRTGMSPKWITEHDGFLFTSNEPWVMCIRHIGFNENAQVKMKHLPDYIEIHKKNPSYGSGPSQNDLRMIRDELRDIKINSAIDWGCGNSRALEKLFPNAKLTFYDPAIPGRDALPKARFNIGLCTDVMEHVPETEIDAMMKSMADVCDDWIFIIHMFPANQLLPDGSNAHVSQHDAMWWVKRISKTFKSARTWPCDTKRCFVRAKAN